MADLSNQAPSSLPWEEFRRAAINAHKIFTYKHPPLSIGRYSFIKLAERKQQVVNKPAENFTWQYDMNQPSFLDENPSLNLLCHSIP